MCGSDMHLAGMVDAEPTTTEVQPDRAAFRPVLRRRIPASHAARIGPHPHAPDRLDVDLVERNGSTRRLAGSVSMGNTGATLDVSGQYLLIPDYDGPHWIGVDGTSGKTR